MKSVVIIECSIVHALVFHCPANSSKNLDVFLFKTICTPREIIPQNFRSLGFAVSEELGNKQTNRLTFSLTDWRFYRMICLFLIMNLSFL